MMLRDGDRSSSPTLPFLTANLPGIGGRIKEQPQDFVVEEIPAYEPCGEGEHLFLWIEKRDIAGEELLRHVARSIGISPRDIGAAGMKDRRAVTRQYLSIPARCETSAARIDCEGIRVLGARRHRNKLRTGHLRGNRFVLAIRGVDRDAFEKASGIESALRQLGCPNYFGDQRFGRDGETLRLGLDLLRGVAKPASIPPSRRRFLLRMALSSAQSAAFNSVLAERLQDGLLHTVLRGDVMQVRETGGLFVAADAAVEQKRFDSRETVLTGPIFGPEMTVPLHEPAEREQLALGHWQLSGTDFTRFPRLTSGTRRPLLLWPHELRIEQEPDALRLTFELPSGAYATTLLRELMKG